MDDFHRLLGSIWGDLGVLCFAKPPVVVTHGFQMIIPVFKCGKEINHSHFQGVTLKVPEMAL